MRIDEIGIFGMSFKVHKIANSFQVDVESHESPSKLG